MTIRIRLDYYDREHRRLLSTTQPYASARTASKVSRFQMHSTIRKADFYSYLLIHRQALDGYKCYSELLGKMNLAAGWIQDVVTSAASTLHLVQADYRDANLADRIGESVGLSVVSSLHGMTDADWTKLDTLPGPNGIQTFDFEIGSDGIRIIQIETKGSFVNDCTKKPSAISNHARGITGKKTEWAAHPHHPHPSSVRYGTIASIDAQHDAQCWLLDPPAENMQIDPLDLRVAKRLGFAAKSIATIAPTATLPRIITERIGQILKRGANSFDGEVLRTPRGNRFSLQNYVETYLSRDKIFIEDLDIVGKLLHLGREAPIFVGMKGDLARSAIKQSVNEIVTMSFNQSELGIREIETDIQGMRHSHKRLPMNFQVSSGGFILGLPVD